MDTNSENKLLLKEEAYQLVGSAIEVRIVSDLC